MPDTLLVLSSPVRREILRLVWSDERPAGEIAREFKVSWPAISQNLRVTNNQNANQFVRRQYRRGWEIPT